MSPAPRRRRPTGRTRSYTHVAPVLDPTWRSPYAPSAEERADNREAVRVVAFRRVRPVVVTGAVLLGVGVVLAVVGLFVPAVSGWWWPLLGLVVLGGAFGWNDLRCRRLEGGGERLARELADAFAPGGSPLEVERLSTIVARLTATFGLSDVAVRIVADGGYNAALLPGDEGLVLLVTSALTEQFSLVEIEGVVAHLMARERLGAIEREVAASLVGWDAAGARQLAGPASAYRADEVAASGTRYPQGLASALHRCASTPPPADSFFLTPTYARTRWIWFDRYADQPSAVLGDLDDVSVRARALAEW